MTRGRPTRCALYTRTLPRSRAGGLNIPGPTQAQRLEAVAIERGWQVLGVWTDAGDDRKGLLEALATIRQGGVLLTYDISRLGTATDAAIWKGVALKYGTRIEFLEPDPPVDPRADEIVTLFADRMDSLFRARKRV